MSITTVSYADVLADPDASCSVLCGEPTYAAPYGQPVCVDHYQDQGGTVVESGPVPTADRRLDEAVRAWQHVRDAEARLDELTARLPLFVSRLSDEQRTEYVRRTTR